MKRVALACVIALCACAPEGDLGGWSARRAEPTDASAADASEPEGDAGTDAACAARTEAGVCGPSSEPGDGLLLTVIPGLTTTYFADGRLLPAGDYTLDYVDGCWHSGVVAWTVNLGGEGYNLVGGDPEVPLGMAPGNVGTFAGLGAYATYEDCVAANVGRAPLAFHFEGGKLGLRLQSLDPLTLFLLIEGGEAVGGRSPTFRLTCSGECR